MEQKITGLLPMDQIKAFNTVQHKILLAELNHYDIRDVVNNFLNRISQTDLKLLYFMIITLQSPISI